MGPIADPSTRPRDSFPPGSPRSTMSRVNGHRPAGRGRVTRPSSERRFQIGLADSWRQHWSVTDRHTTNPDRTRREQTPAEPDEGSGVSCQDNNSADRRQQTPSRRHSQGAQDVPRSSVPPPVTSRPLTSRPLTSRRWTLADPPRIERVKKKCTYAVGCGSTRR